MTKMSLVNPATIRKYTFRNWSPTRLTSGPNSGPFWYSSNCVCLLPLP